MKIAFATLCTFLFAFGSPCFAEPQEETLFTGQITAGAWHGQLDMAFTIPTMVDVTQSFSKHLVCVDAGDTDDQGPCVAWGCWASFSVPLKVEVTIRSTGFTSPPASASETLQYGIPQSDCRNPALELGEAQTQMQRSVVSLGMDAIQTGASTTTALASAYVSATLVPGVQPGSAQLTNFSYDQGTPQIAVANPRIFLSEYDGTLKRAK